MAEYITDIPLKHLITGIAGHYVHGSNMTLGLVEMKAGTGIPAHQHVHEQITYILEGEIEMVIGGVDYILKPGMYHVIPSNTVHSGIAKVDCKLIDVFAPVREEYRQ